MPADSGPTLAEGRQAPPAVHPTAIVEEGAHLGPGTVIGPYAFVGARVELGPGCVLHQGAIVTGRSVLGANNQVFPYAVLGTVPQDKKYQGEDTGLTVGDGNVFREHVTINIGTDAGSGQTVIGRGNLLMAGVHVGHDCEIGDHCVLANATGLAGHVILEDHVILGGQTGIHQFVRVGAHCMTSGGSKVGKDIPPFTIAQGYPARLRGINHVGLRRRGFSDATIRALKQAYRTVFRGEARLEDALAKVREELAGSVEVRRFVDFLVASQSSRGFLTAMRPSEENGQGDEGEDL